MEKKSLIAIMLVIFSLIFAGCGKNTGLDTSKDGKISVVCTTFPQYDWMREITKGHEDCVDLKLLIDNGVDIHSYQPTADDIIMMSECDLLIYVGGESDAWVNDVIKQADNDDMRVVNMLEALGSRVKEETVVEGMQEEEHEETEETGYDEHIWLSLKNASYLVDALKDEMSDIDPEHASVYEENASNYKQRLDELDKKYEEMVTTSGRDTILFGDRFPFVYLTEDYGLKYYAAFVGCSAETEASIDTVTFLAQKVDELKLNYVLIIDGSDGRLAQTIIDSSSNKSAGILTLDSIQSVTKSDIEAGETYIGDMEENLKVLGEALK